MTAGSISVPTIIPLRAPVVGKLKNVIDTSVAIELRTETQNAEIYFTVDGSKPDPFAPLGSDTNTIKYTRPFKLREGKRTVKAIGVAKDGTRESNIVTKTFEVEKNLENVEIFKDDGYAFIDELQKEKKQAAQTKRGILKNISENSRSFQQNDTFRSTGSLSDGENRAETKFLGQRFANRGFSATVNHNTSHHSTNHHKSSHHNASHYNLNDSRMSTNNRSHLSNEDLSASSVHHRYVLPDSSTQALRLQRETDFLKCIYCFATRPSDPFAKYCNDCGRTLPQIPQNKLPPPELGQLGKCFYCKSNVPFNTTICVICEKPIMPQLQPQASIKLQGKIICPICTTGNPSNYTTCVTCENKLPIDAKIYPVDFNAPLLPYTATSATPAPHHNQTPTPGRTVTCSQCFRLNNNDARFCDWCGAKPQKSTKPINCGKCGANNHSHSKFCTSCGVILQAPIHTLNTQALTLNMNTSANSTWLTPSDFSYKGKYYSTVSTQTFGIFYTSAKGLDVKTEKEEKQVEVEKKLHDKKPLLTAVSAGKGYWRQQLDHICAHLKAFAQNNPEFRSLVSEPRLGKINSAKVDVDSNWCSITASFPIRSNKNKDIFNSSALIDHKLGIGRFNDTDYEMMAITGTKSTSESDESEQSGSDTERSINHSKDHHDKKKKHKKKRFDKTAKNEDRLNPEDRQLFKELSKDGKGHLREVTQFLQEGANVNAVNKDGLNALHLAIRNKHFDCISTILDANVDITSRIPPHGNTALHEAVLLGGKDSETVIKFLLDYQANPSWKNNKNETPYDLAVKKGNTNAINCFNAHTSDAMLKDYTRSKSVSIKP